MLIITLSNLDGRRPCLVLRRLWSRLQLWLIQRGQHSFYFYFFNFYSKYSVPSMSSSPPSPSPSWLFLLRPGSQDKLLYLAFIHAPSNPWMKDDHPEVSFWAGFGTNEKAFYMKSPLSPQSRVHTPLMIIIITIMIIIITIIIVKLLLKEPPFSPLPPPRVCNKPVAFATIL